MRFQEHFETASCMVDKNDNIRPSDLVRFMQETADHQMRDEKPSYADLFRQGQAFIVTRMVIQIHAQLHEYDKVDGYTWSAGHKGATFYRNYLLKRGDELAAEAYSEWTVVDHRTGKLCRVSDVDISNFSKDEMIEPQLPKRFRYPKGQEFEQLDTHIVRYSECDMNRHMNNAVYFNLLWDYIPGVSEKEVTSMNIRFMHEAAEGSSMEIYRTQLDPAVAGDAAAEEVYGFRTSVDGKTNVECVFGVRRTENQGFIDAFLAESQNGGTEN